MRNPNTGYVPSLPLGFNFNTLTVVMSKDLGIKKTLFISQIP